MSFQNISQKINLCYYSTFKGLLLHNPSYKLLTNYQELLFILELNKDEIKKFFYFNESSINNNILYNAEEIIKIKYIEKLKLSELFYLYLLIIDNSELIFYTYNINSIYEINNIQRNISDDKLLKKIILSKIVIQLIENYKESDEYKLYEECELEIIEDENKSIISQCNHMNNRSEYSLLKFEFIEKNSLEDIYLKIIFQLIKINKFELYDNVYKFIIEELELESINITKKMYDILYTKILNIDNENIKKNYILSNKEDLKDIKKINFYYFLLKALFKNSFYIYQFPLLFNARKNIIKLIKNNFNQLCIFTKDSIKNKIDYVIKTLTDSDFYYNKYLNFNVQPLLEVLNYYKNYFPETKRQDIDIIDKMIKNNKINGEINYLLDYDIAKSMNIKYPIINYIFYLKIKYENFKTTEEDFNKSIQIWEKLEKIIKTKKIKKIVKSLKIGLINFFNDINNKEILNNFFEKDILDYFIKENKKFLDKNKYINDLNCINDITTINKNIRNKGIIENSEKETNIDNNSINTSINNYLKDVIKKRNINSKTLKNNSEKNDIKDKLRIESNLHYNIIKEFSDNKPNLLYINKNTSKNKILEFIKTIEKLKNSAEFIKELSNGFYISTNSGDKGDRALFIYNQFYEKISEIKNLEDIIYNAYEINYDINKAQIQIMICLNRCFYIITIDIKGNKISSQRYNGNSYFVFLIMEKDEKKVCIFSGENGTLISNLFYEESNQWLASISSTSFRGAIRISNNIVALVSNSIINDDGEDQIMIYNTETKNIINQIFGYSFNLSSNGLCLIPREEIESDSKILLCSCKAYSPEQKNGILLINISDFTKNEFFYETGNYEVYCLCPILIVENKNPKESDITFKENITIKDTEYFLVGGYDKEERKGVIKLFKVLYNEENIDLNTNITTNFIQDIIIDKNNKYNFEGFNKPISCITQSKITGNILITCLDGNIYLFYPPNI